MEEEFTCNGKKVRIVAVKSKYGIGNFKYWTADVYEDGVLVLEGDALENDPQISINNAEREYMLENGGTK